MKLVTWNVNSIRARADRLAELLALHRPDVVCLQETKVDAASFPHDGLRAAGYHAADHSGGRWCGVAIVVPLDTVLADVRVGLADQPDPDQARWIEATVDGVRIVSTYVPNGQAIGSDPFASKLRFFAVAAARARALAGGPLVIAGDMNVAPADVDVWDVAAFAGSTHVTDAERDGREALRAAGALVDAWRALHPDDPGHSWWDYRAGAYHKRQGMRIDHVLVSPPIAAGLVDATVDRDFRKGARPSDHAPVIVEWT
jgi:exodeoxyribonuclease-3